MQFFHELYESLNKSMEMEETLKENPIYSDVIIC